MKKIAIIGAGISGLAAAYALQKEREAGAPLEYRILDSSERAGGVICTERIEGCVVEGGPDSFLTEKSWASDFCRELGLGDQLIHSNDAGRKTYIYLNRGLIALPDGLAFMVPTKVRPIVFSPLFSWKTKLAMLREWFFPPRNAKVDESVAQFVGRHYDTEMVDRLTDPLLAGVYGGNAAQLSVRSVLPRFVEMEKRFGSLSRGMIAARKQISRSSPAIFTSLCGGMQQLVEAILPKVSSSLRTGKRVDCVQWEKEQWTVSEDGEESRFDGLIMAVPACAASTILKAGAPELAQELAAIPYSSSVTVAMAFQRSDLISLPPGFGVLLPRSSGKRILAITFVDQKFLHRAPDELGLIRCVLGGTDDEQAVNLVDSAIVKIVQNELREILAITGEPRFSRVFKWSRAMAQYTVGHEERMQRISALTARLPHLAFAGNAYAGIGIPDCIRSGQAAAKQILMGLT